MIIKKFTAPTMREAMHKVKKELGEDAIILKSEKVSKGGLFDFSETKHEFEVTAAVDRAPLRSFKDKKEDEVQKKEVVRQFAETAPSSAPAGRNLQNIDTKFKIIDLKSDLKTIESKIDTVAKHVKYNEMPNLPESLIPYYIRLKKSFVEERIVKDIMMQVYMDFKGEEFKNRNLIEKKLKKLIMEKLNVAGIEEQQKVFAGPRVIAFVGPTGVGKTTTLAKMAFNSSVFGKKKVGLITADTYKISAIDQLKTYSSITQIPLEIVYKPEQIKSALNKFHDFDIVLVDTAGRSQRNLQQLSELKQILFEGGIIDVYLVMSITTREEDQDDILKRFSAVNFNRVIFTKLDETSGFGGLLNSSVYYNVPVVMLTYGQNVPDDIVFAEKDKIADLILYPDKNRMF